MIWIFSVAYLVLFVLTWGATYSYFTNRYKILDSGLERRKNLAFAVGWSFLQPITGLVTIFTSAFFYYGFQWWGGPRQK